MKKGQLRAFVFSMIAALGTTGSLFAAAGGISPVTVVSPTAGQRLAGGGKHIIAWNYAGSKPLAVCSVFCRIDPKVGWEFVGATKGNISNILWTLPKNAVSDCAIIRVKTLDTQRAFAIGLSSEFSIIDTIAPVVTLAPVPEKAAPASKMKIQWNAQDEIGVTSVALYHATAEPGWNLVTDLLTSDSEYEWEVPATPSDVNYLMVLATDRAGNVGIKFTDAFKIAAGSGIISPDSVIVPAGGKLSYRMEFDTVGLGEPSNIFIVGKKPSWNVAVMGNLILGGPVPLTPSQDTIRIKYKMAKQMQEFGLRIIVSQPAPAIDPTSSAKRGSWGVTVSASAVPAFSVPAEAKDFSLDIFDCAGRRLWSYRSSGIRGAQVLQGPQRLQNGVYWAAISTPNQTTRQVFRIIK